MRPSFVSKHSNRAMYAPYSIGRDFVHFRRISTTRMFYEDDFMSTSNLYDNREDDGYSNECPGDDSSRTRVDIYQQLHGPIMTSEYIERERERERSAIVKSTSGVQPEDEIGQTPTDESMNRSERVRRSASSGMAAGVTQLTGSMKDKLCHVCGDKALGYNFNAISCESCKAFFRRNAFKEIRGRCEGKCDVTVESRSYCKRCRLQKCFTVGMKRELILNDQQKQIRCRKIRENRIRRLGGQNADDASNDFVSQTQSSSSQESNKMGDGACSSSVPGDVQPKEPVTHVIASVVNPDVADGLTDGSRVLIKEMMHAFQITFDNAMERQPTAAPSNVEFLNMADTSVRRLVKMAKHLSHFRSLDQEDQIQLLKGAVVEVLVFRSSKMFNPETMAWQVNKEGQDHSVSAMSLKLGSPESMAFILQYRRFVGSLLRATCGDNIILMLLIVMTVFSPDRVGQSSIGCVARIQEEYANVLREYVESRFPNDTLMIARILQRLCDIRDLNEKHTTMLMNMKVEDLEPLIIEIFDL